MHNEHRTALSENDLRPIPGARKARSLEGAELDARADITLVFRESATVPHQDLVAFARTYRLRRDGDRGPYGIHLSGALRDLARAFGLSGFSYWTVGESTAAAAAYQYRAPDGTPSLPARWAQSVRAVLGLDTALALRANRPRRVAPDSMSAENVPNPSLFPPNGYFPAELATIYKFPPESLGEGQTIGIIAQTADEPPGFTAGFYPADVNLYFELVGITPPPRIEIVSVDGAKNTPTNADSNGDGEVCLDIETAGSVAPRARILVFFAPYTYRGFYDGMAAMLHEYRVDVASISLGFIEVNVPPAIQRAFDELFASAADHSTVFSSSGDNGSTNEQAFFFVDRPPAPYIPPPATANLIFPSNCPHCVAVGGTSLHTNGQHTSRICEVVWNWQDGAFATTGGVSDVFDVPDYQRRHGIVPRSANQHKVGRGVPDVAANADGLVGYKVRVDGVNEVFGGNSASTPLWAGLMARMNAIRGRNFGFVNPLLYDHPEGFHKIRSGDNGQYVARRRGYDLCTGLGVPSARLLPALLGADAGATSRRATREPRSVVPAVTPAPPRVVSVVKSRSPATTKPGRRVIADSTHRPVQGALRQRELSAAELKSEKVGLTVIFQSEPSAADVAGLAAFGSRHGFVDDGERGPFARRLLGRASDAVKAFALDGLGWWEQSDGKRYRAHDGLISLPASEPWSAQVLYVAGFETHALRGPDHHGPNVVEPKRAAAAARGESASSSRLDGVNTGECPVQIGPWFPNGYLVNDLVKLYGFPPEGFGVGQTIALVELGGGYLESDLATYWTLVGVATPPEVTFVGVDGATNTFSPFDFFSTDDIEVVGNVAQRSKIVVVFGPNTFDGMYDAFAHALFVERVQVAATSYGFAEIYWPPPFAHAINRLFERAAGETTVVCNAMSQGSSDGVEDGQAHVDFPASAPFALGVGITTLLTNGNHAFAKRLCEVAWNQGDVDVAGIPRATGGGVSDLFPVPAYQASHGILPRSANDGHHVGRGVPDVTMMSDRYYSYKLWFNGEPIYVGGAVPNVAMWVGLLARLNNVAGRALGFVNPLLYDHADAFHDITRGDNGAYRARRGWDAVSGLGVPTCRLAAVVKCVSTARKRRRNRKERSKRHA